MLGHVQRMPEETPEILCDRVQQLLDTKKPPLHKLY